MMRRSFRLALAAFLAALPAHAVVLDWDNSTVDWPFTGNATRTFSSSFDVDPANPGNDITITISGATGNITNDNSPAAGYIPPPGFPSSYVTSPDDHNGAAGGFGGGNETGLYLFVNFINNTAGANLTVTITFSANYTYGVTGVSFPITDVDYVAGSYTDQIRNLTGSYYGTPVANATLTALSNSTVNVAIANSGTANATATGTGATDDIAEGFSNINVNFGSTPVNQVSFVWGSGSTAPANPGNQLIALYDISFTAAVPEPSTFAAAAILLCAALCARRRFQRR
jgi:hypothetical protein